MNKKIVSVIFGFAWSFSALATENSGDYKCIVNHAGNVTNTGDISDVKSWEFFIGEEFVVERKTGAIAGKPFKNNIASIKPQVYDDEYNGYAVVAPSHNEVVSYLQINNFKKTLRKPFIYIMTNVILTGTCEQY